MVHCSRMDRRTGCIHPIWCAWQSVPSDFPTPIRHPRFVRRAGLLSCRAVFPPELESMTTRQNFLPIRQPLLTIFAGQAIKQACAGKCILLGRINCMDLRRDLPQTFIRPISVGLPTIASQVRELIGGITIWVRSRALVWLK